MNIILFDKDTIPKEIPANGEAGRHIRKILRLKEGDTFRCGLVNGPPGTAEITGINNSGITFTWEQSGEKESLYPLTLLAGYTRPISSKRILREAASLGVERIIFTGTDTGEKSYRESTLWKSGEYRKFLINGAQQAGGTAIPEVLFYPDVKHTLQAVTGERFSRLLLLDNIDPRGKLSGYPAPESGTEESWVLAIGSERGWSGRERELFDEYGFISLSLGNRILRTETACSAGIAVALSRMGLL